MDIITDWLFTCKTLDLTEVVRIRYQGELVGSSGGAGVPLGLDWNRKPRAFIRCGFFEELAYCEVNTAFDLSIFYTLTFGEK